MSENQPMQPLNLPPGPVQFFFETPTWKSNDQFVITGAELEKLSHFFNFFATPLNIVNRLIAEGVSQGAIKMEYTYRDGEKKGQPVPKEELDQYFKEREEHLKQVQEHLTQLQKANPLSKVE